MLQVKTKEQEEYVRSLVEKESCDGDVTICDDSVNYRVDCCYDVDISFDTMAKIVDYLRKENEAVEIPTTCRVSADLNGVIFRGFDGTKWYYGDLEYNRKTDVARIHTYKEEGSYSRQYAVDPDTVGQYTGMTDKHGVKIYEGDIVKRSSVDSDDSRYYYCGVVFFDGRDASFKLRMFKQVFDGRDIGLFEGVDDIECNFVTNVVYDGQTPQEYEYLYEVIGNIHDNPELLATK